MQYTFDHLHLKAEDVESTVRWYADVLAAQVGEPTVFRGSIEYRLTLAGGTIVVHGQLEDELPLPVSVHPRFGVDHFGVTVADLDAALRDLQSKGVDILEPPWEVTPGTRMACIAAPDRVRIELIERGHEQEVQT